MLFNPLVVQLKGRNYVLISMVVESSDLGVVHRSIYKSILLEHL
jgi:hypothetical protein